MSVALIFSRNISPRLSYLAGFLSDYYGFSFGLTCDKEQYIRAVDLCKINYSTERLTSAEIFIRAAGLLSESGIRHVAVECFEMNKQSPDVLQYKAFFKSDDDIGFDIFAAVFYLLSRYEEYLPHQKDSYGRFAHENAAAFRNGFLHLPLVNIWLEDFRGLLAKRNSQFLIPRTSFSFLPTYDIDMAWSFRGKGFRRNAGAILLSLLQLRLHKLRQRLDVLLGRREDPFDAYDWLDQLHREYNLRPVYFFLVAKKNNRVDRNIHPAKPAFRRLVREIASSHTVGLHPSWASGDRPSLLRVEKALLEQMADRPVDSSRQHFVRFDLPGTYRRLLDAGIVHDHSMGYGSINGFRASIASPFYWYDLSREEKTGLLVHPFCFMDANAYYEQKVSPEKALEELMQYYHLIRSVNGTMIPIWHNSFLGSDEAFTDWKEIYRRFVAAVSVDEKGRL
jgi:hypothetical protein